MMYDKELVDAIVLHVLRHPQAFSEVSQGYAGPIANDRAFPLWPYTATCLCSPLIQRLPLVAV